MVVPELALGLLTNLLSDYAKASFGKLSNPSVKAYDNAVEKLDKKYGLNGTLIDNFLHRENVKAAIKEHLFKPNDSEFLNGLTNEFLLSYNDISSREYANSILSTFFVLLDDEIKNIPELRQEIHYLLDKQTHEAVQDTLGLVRKMSASQTEKPEKPESAVNEHIIKYTKSFFKNICNNCMSKNKNILIIGDVMLDHKIKGTSAKYEDVQKHQIIQGGGGVYMVSGEPKTLGGAADIAMAFSNISNVTLIGVVGSDCAGNTLNKICKDHNIQCYLDQTSKVKTTTKIYIHRITEKGPKNVIRFDNEDIKVMKKYCQSEEVRKRLITKIEEYATSTDCIVIKDHQKGMISEELVNEIAKIATDKGIPFYVDPKYNWQIFKGMEIEAILPNMKEAASALYDIKNQEGIILEKDLYCRLEKNEYDKLVKNYPNCKNFIIKAASKGAVIMSQSPEVCSKYTNPFLVEERKTINPFFVEEKDFETDVGCGDIFDAFMIIGMLNKSTLVESALFANFIAGLKTKKSLGEHISLDDIREEIKKDSFEKYISDNSKLISEEMDRHLSQ